MMDWEHFREIRGGLVHEPLARKIWRLSEPGLRPDLRSFFYAIETDDCAILIDGGWGLVRDRRDLPFAPGLPLISIATHSHSDHIGALHLATTRYGHAAEADVYRTADAYETQARPWIDDLDFSATGETIDPASYRQIPCPLTHHISEGNRLVFGDVILRVLHTPGHSPGSVCLLEEGAGLLFCGDIVHDGYIYDDIPDADADLLALSHSRILDVEFTTACPGHGALLSRHEVAKRIARYRADREHGDG